MNCNKEIQQKSCCEPIMVWADASDYYTKQEVDKLISAVTVSGVSEAWVEDYTYDKKTIDSKYAEKLAVSDFQTYSGTVASELSGKASQSLVDTLSGQIQSISSSTSGDVASISSDLSAHTANTSIHVTTAQTSAWDAKQNALTAGSGISIINDVISVTGGTEGITSAQCQAQIDQSISGKTNQSDFSAHTANTSIHVTTAQTASWDAKSDFSGSYNDLTDKPTIPTSNTAFTNDAGYITSSALSGYAESTAVTQEISAAVSGKTNESDFSAHTANTTVHITSTERNTWNAKADVWVGDETAWSQISGNTQQGVIYLVF